MLRVINKLANSEPLKTDKHTGRKGVSASLAGLVLSGLIYMPPQATNLHSSEKVLNIPAESLNYQANAVAQFIGDEILQKAMEVNDGNNVTFQQTNEFLPGGLTIDFTDTVADRKSRTQTVFTGDITIPETTYWPKLPSNVEELGLTRDVQPIGAAPLTEFGKEYSFSMYNIGGEGWRTVSRDSTGQVDFRSALPQGVAGIIKPLTETLLDKQMVLAEADLESIPS
ncbi:MAG TPA: hypothetical protein VMR95_00080 [Candidatus Binatia bacterium]|nr:hypothetical protein [Candidatus Binatia bacterium]